MKINKTFGNFEITSLVAFEGEQTLEAAGRELASLGALYLFERSVSSNAEAQVFGNLLGWEKNKKEGFKRPAGFNRSSVDYSVSIAESLKFEFTTSVELPSGQSVRFHGVTVTENTGSNPADTKELLALVKEFFALAPEKRTVVAAKFKITVITHESVTEGCRVFLAEKKAKLKAEVKNAFA